MLLLEPNWSTNLSKFMLMLRSQTVNDFQAIRNVFEVNKLGENWRKLPWWNTRKTLFILPVIKRRWDGLRNFICARWWWGKWRGMKASPLLSGKSTRPFRPRRASCHSVSSASHLSLNKQLPGRGKKRSSSASRPSLKHLEGSLEAIAPALRAFAVKNWG